MGSEMCIRDRTSRPRRIGRFHRYRQRRHDLMFLRRRHRRRELFLSPRRRRARRPLSPSSRLRVFPSLPSRPAPARVARCVFFLVYSRLFPSRHRVSRRVKDSRLCSFRLARASRSAGQSPGRPTHRSFARRTPPRRGGATARARSRARAIVDRRAPALARSRARDAARAVKATHSIKVVNSNRRGDDALAPRRARVRERRGGGARVGNARGAGRRAGDARGDADDVGEGWTRERDARDDAGGRDERRASDASVDRTDADVGERCDVEEKRR